MNIRKIYKLFAVLLLLLSSARSFAQSYWFKSIGLSEGLSSSQVNTICKDSKGFVWIGTSAGLNRFDGFSIRQFQSNYLQSHALPDSYISSIQEGYDGTLWIKTSGGYVAFDPDAQLFDRSVAQRLGVLDANIEPDLMFFDHWRNLWVYDSKRALYFYKAKQQLVYTMRFDDEHVGLRKGTISDLYEVNEGVLAVYTNGTVCCISGEQQKVLWYNDVIANNTTQDDDYKIFGDIEGNIVIYGDAHSYYYDRNTKRWFRSIGELVSEWGGGDVIGNELITGVAQAKNGNLWISTDRGGLLLLDPVKHKVVAHITSNEMRGLPSDQLRTVYVDDTDLLWVGSFRNGVSYYAPNLYLFDVSNVGDVYGMSEDSHGGLWFATHGSGLVYRNPSDGTSQSYSTLQGLNDNLLSCVLCASDGTVWAGSNRFGLNCITSNGVRIFQASQSGLKDNDIQDLVEDKFKNIWIATRKGGLQCYNPKSGKFSDFCVRNGKLLSDNVTSLCCNNNCLVAGTTNGIMVLNLSSNVTAQYTGTVSGDKHFSSNVVTQVFADSRGLIWVGTREGINVLDTSADQLVTFNTSNGMASNVICGIEEDKNHDIWITTAKGVNRVSIQNAATEDSRFSFNFYGYTVADGLQGVEFNKGAIMSTRSGRIFMGGQHGVNWIHNISTQPRKNTLSVLLASLVVDEQPIEVGVSYEGKVILDRTLNSIATLKLRSGVQNIMISLGVNDYNHAEPARFIYQLEGRNDAWLPVSGDGHTLTLSGLGSGKYTLHIKAMLDDGKTVSEEHVLVIEIDKPWYLTWWLLLLIALGLGAIVYGVWKAWPYVVGYYQDRRAEIKALRKRQDELETVARDLRAGVVSMIPQLGLLQMEVNGSAQKEMLNGLQHSARKMLSDLNKLKENSTLVVGDHGVSTGVTPTVGDDVLIGDDGVVGDNDNMGMGAEFLVSDDGIMSASGVPIPMNSGMQKHVVFVVEPDADMLEFVADCLKNTFQIHTFTSAEDCWNAIADLRPNIIMCAENLVGISGSALCEQIKNERSYERIPFILTTDGVLSQAELSMKKITLLADDYIPSPYNLQSVIVRINKMLGEPDSMEVVRDDTMRGADAMLNAVNLYLRQLLDQYIRQNISRKELSVEEMGRVLGVSRTVLFRKIEKVTSKAPSDYIRYVRLQESAKLLETGYVSPAEAAQELGFGNLATFSRFFQNEFGVLPSEYADGKRKK